MTKLLMMTLTPQLRKIAEKESITPIIISKTQYRFPKTSSNLEQAEIKIKLEKTENLKLQYVENFQTTTSHQNNFQDYDNELAETNTQILNIFEKKPNCKSKLSFNKWCNYCRRYGHSIVECRQKA